MYLAFVLLFSTHCVAHFGVLFNRYQKVSLATIVYIIKYQCLLLENQSHIIHRPATAPFNSIVQK